jgi:hypothetical protein
MIEGMILGGGFVAGVVVGAFFGLLVGGDVD